MRIFSAAPNCYNSPPRRPRRPFQIIPACLPANPRPPGPQRAQNRATPKGRQVTEEARAEVRALLGDGAPQRDLLIEYLHLIQDRHNCLSAAHLAALAETMKLSMTEVYEVASFYAHFDIVMEGEDPPPAQTIRVCDSIACQLAGAEELLRAVRDGAPNARVLRAPCMGRCERAPVAALGKHHVCAADAEGVLAALKSGRAEAEMPDYTRFDAYREAGGYRLLGECIGGKRDAESVMAALDAAGLRGLGGAGFPAGRKWRIVRGYDAPRLMAVNADEGEPGTFKDRFYLESDPHRFIEGMLIAAWAAGCEKTYLYVRDEYPAVREILRAEWSARAAPACRAHRTTSAARRRRVYLRRRIGDD